MSVIELLAALKQRYQGDPRVVVVYLFGSQAKGNARAESDVDVAVLYAWGALPSTDEYFTEREALSNNPKYSRTVPPQGH